MSNYDRLRELLAKETFPNLFTFKFIGKNTLGFAAGLQELTRKKPLLRETSRKSSRNHKHLSVTYSFPAEEAERIVEVYQLIAEIPDILVVL